MCDLSTNYVTIYNNKCIIWVKFRYIIIQTTEWILFQDDVGLILKLLCNLYSKKQKNSSVIKHCLKPSILHLFKIKAYYVK